MKKIMIFFFVLSVIICANAFAREKTSQEIQEERARINKNPAVIVFNAMIKNATLADCENIAGSDKLLLTYVITKQLKQNASNIYEAEILIVSLDPRIADIAYNRAKAELDTTVHQIRFLSWIAYNKTGDVINKDPVLSSQWINISPKSFLYKKIADQDLSYDELLYEIKISEKIRNFVSRALCGFEKQTNLSEIIPPRPSPSQPVIAPARNTSQALPPSTAKTPSPNSSTAAIAALVPLVGFALFVWINFLLMRKAVKDGILRAHKVIQKTVEGNTSPCPPAIKFSSEDSLQPASDEADYWDKRKRIEDAIKNHRLITFKYHRRSEIVLEPMYLKKYKSHCVIGRRQSDGAIRAYKIKDMIF
ncbi:hypothetical protein [Pyramidobacter sp.]|uniref:hypothetical protein n=1 Tax=Pyramidobacter sp. TaxID=1943581 RepID=UPI003331BF56